MADEGYIKEPNYGSSHTMLQEGSPKTLWEHAIELEDMIRSHTALDIYALEGQVPEAVMPRPTTDISNLCEYKWFQWVIYYEPITGYPDSKKSIGRNLGPAIDVGNAMTYKMLKSNGVMSDAWL